MLQIMPFKGTQRDICTQEHWARIRTTGVSHNKVWLSFHPTIETIKLEWYSSQVSGRNKDAHRTLFHVVVLLHVMC